MIRYKSGYKYQLVEDAYFQLQFAPPEDIHTDYIDFSIDGLLTVKKGYAWDGPSGPTIDTKNSMQGSLAHDALYQMMRQEYLPNSFRVMADLELERICISDGMWPFRATLWRRMVNWFAKSASMPYNEKKIHEAP